VTALDDLERLMTEAPARPWRVSNCNNPGHPERPPMACYAVRDAEGNEVRARDLIVGLANNADVMLAEVRALRAWARWLSHRYVGGGHGLTAELVSVVGERPSAGESVDALYEAAEQAIEQLRAVRR
jgi:hypothetical protein